MLDLVYKGCMYANEEQRVRGRGATTAAHGAAGSRAAGHYRAGSSGVAGVAYCLASINTGVYGKLISSV